MLDRESSMTVYAIYIVNPDDTYRTYTSVHYKRFWTWEEIKEDEELCYDALFSPISYIPKIKK